MYLELKNKLNKELKMSNNLKKMRLENRLTQEELAKIIGISQQQLSQYEKGINYPKIEIAKKLSDFFNISINEIFF